MTAADLTLERSGNDLVFKVNGSSDWVKVSGMLGGGNVNSLNQVQFADGTVWNQTALFAQTITGYGTAGGDYIVGYNEGPNISYGLDGNDQIYGGTNSDRLDGGTGNDYLEGGSGNDTLTGGTGNDTLSGGTGSDTYVFGRGDGADIISESDSTAGNTDVAQFGTNIAADQLWFQHAGSNLEVSVIGTSDKLTIQNWYSGASYHVEQFRTAGGKLLLDSQVENLVSAMAAFAPPSAGQTTLPQAYQDELAPKIAANWQ